MPHSTVWNTPGQTKRQRKKISRSYERISIENGGFSLQLGQFAQKFQVEVAPCINYSSCQKTRMNDLSCSIRMWAQVPFVSSQCTRLTVRQTDRQTDRRTEKPCNTVRCITCSRTVIKRLFQLRNSFLMVAFPSF